MAYVSLDSDQIKKAHKKHKYSKEQVEHLEKCMDEKTGPLYFMNQIMKIGLTSTIVCGVVNGIHQIRNVHQKDPELYLLHFNKLLSLTLQN